MIAPARHAAFLQREYLQSFVAEGGSAVKFVVPGDPSAAEAFRDALRAHAVASGFQVVRVDAAQTRVHLMDEVFFAVARQIDWPELSRRAVVRAWEDSGWPAGHDLTVQAVAALHVADAGELWRDVNRTLQRTVYADFALLQEFRTAALRLCQAQLGNGQVTEAEANAVMDWLKGEIRQLAPLRSAGIHRRIAKSNARQLLFSLSRWLATYGHRGLLLELDITRLGFSRRPSAEERQGFYYTKGTLLDSYELIRQLVDNTDELAHCCVVVLAAPEFLSDPNRGVDLYQALKLRIHDEVRDRVRDNPFSSLVRIGTPAEAP